VELRGRDASDAPDALDRERMQEPELASGLHDEQSVRLRDAARHLRQELGAGDADGDRQPDTLAGRTAEPFGDLRCRPGDPLHASHV